MIVHRKLPLTSTHQVVCLNDVKSGKVGLNSILNQKQVYCPIHHDKPLELFCKQENCLLCLGCAIVKHRDHPYDFVSQTVEEQKEEMKLLLPDVEATVTLLEFAITEIENQQFQIQARKNENLLKITQTFEEIIATISERKEKLLNFITRVTHTKIQSLNKQLNEMKALLHQMKRFSEFIDKTIKSGSNCTVMCMKNPITNRSNSLVEWFKLKPSEFLPRKLEFQTLDNMIVIIKQLATTPHAQKCSRMICVKISVSLS